VSASTICHGCGQRLHVPADYTRAKMRCPDCGVMCELPPMKDRETTMKRSARRAAPVPPPPAPPPTAVDLPIQVKPEPGLPLTADVEFSDDPEDGKPYRVTGATERECPGCGSQLDPQTTQCPGCGRELQTGKKPKKVYTPVALTWEAGWPFRKRLNVFALGMMITVVCGILMMGLEGQWASMLLSWAIFAGLSSFLLGTYPRVDLTRDQRGRVTLTKTWRACFLERPPIQFDVREFQGVRTGFDRDVHFLDWIIACLLLGVGIVPGIIWWYIFIQLDQHTVVLVREHGYGSDVLYRGVSEKMAKEIAYALDDIGGLPYENG
jgi:hypothetical protein